MERLIAQVALLIGFRDAVYLDLLGSEAFEQHDQMMWSSERFGQPAHGDSRCERPRSVLQHRKDVAKRDIVVARL